MTNPSKVILKAPHVQSADAAIALTSSANDAMSTLSQPSTVVAHHHVSTDSGVSTVPAASPVSSQRDEKGAKRVFGKKEGGLNKKPWAKKKKDASPDTPKVPPPTEVTVGSRRWRAQQAAIAAAAEAAAKEKQSKAKAAAAVKQNNGVTTVTPSSKTHIKRTDAAKKASKALNSGAVQATKKSRADSDKHKSICALPSEVKIKRKLHLLPAPAYAAVALHSAAATDDGASDGAAAFKPECWACDLPLRHAQWAHAPKKTLMFVACAVGARLGLWSESTSSAADTSTPQLANASAVDAHAFVRFVNRIGELYMNNAYHSAVHAADVTQGFYALLATQCRVPLLPHMDAIERLAALVAAIGHDVGHPGRSNQFMVAIQDPVAARFDNKAVLENFHAATTLAVMAEPACNLTAKMTPEDAERFRRTVSALILGTEMASAHARLLALQKGGAPITPGGEGSQSVAVGEATVSIDRRAWPAAAAAGTDFDARIEVLAEILHAADIANAARPYAIAKKWSESVRNEFISQGEDEERRGLPVSPGMAKTSDAIAGQLFFMDLFCIPLFRFLAETVLQTDVFATLMETRAAFAKAKDAAAA